MKHNKASGFTLLEVLLVVALLSVIFVGAISLYQVRVTNYRIDKTALRIQQWLQAGQNYYADHGKWPMKGNELTPYLPIGSEKNAWGLVIQISDKQMATDHLLRIETKLPEQNSHISTRIAGLLPNAAVDPTSNAVVAEVAAPTSTANLDNGQRLVSIQNVKMPLAENSDLKQVLHLPTDEECPKGTHQPHVYYAIAEAHFNVSKRIPHLLKHIKGIPLNWQDNVSATLTPQLEARAIITHSIQQESEDPENLRQVGSDGEYANKEGALLAIVTCEKIAESSQTPPKSHYIF